MVVLAIITSLFIAIQDPIVQKFAVRFAGGYLSEKTGADIKVGRLVVTPDFRVFMDDVSVKDLNNNNLASIGALRTKIDIGDLLDGKVHLEHLELRDVDANIVQYEGEDRFNFAFLVDAFPSDTVEKPDKAPMPIIVDKISLKNVDFVLWNQNTDNIEKTENHLMDYSHLDLDDINLEAKNFYMLGDSIRADIGSLSATELSGLEVKRFKSNAVVCSKGIFLDDMQMETNNSRFDLDLHMKYNGFDDFSTFVDSVVFDATIRPTEVMLSDIGVFTDVMYKMPEKVKFEGRFTGPIEHFRVDDIKAEVGKSTSFEGSISMHPLDFENGYHTLNVKNMRFTYDDLANFHIPSNTKTIPLPESLRSMESGRLSLDFKGSYNNFDSDIQLTSGIGDIDASISRTKYKNGDNVFDGFIHADRVKAGTVANISKYVGDLDLDADFSVRFPQEGNPELSVNGQASKVRLLGKDLNVIRLDGSMEQNLFKGFLKVDDNDLSLDFNGLIDFQNAKHPKSDFEAFIRDADLKALGIMKGDSISRISTRIYANMTGFNLDDLEGSLRLDSTLYCDSRGKYYMDSFNASITNDNLMMRRINLDCDFLNFEMAGKMNFAHLVPVFKSYVNHYMRIPLWEEELAEFEEKREKEDVEQDFVVNLTLKDTKTLSRLLMPSLQIAKNTTVNGTFTSRSNAFNLTARSKHLQVGELHFNDLELRNYHIGNRSAVTSLSLDEISYSRISPSDTLQIGLDNISIVTRMADDTLHARIRWDDDTIADFNKGLVRTYFHPHEKGGIFSITKADIRVNDSLWNVSSDNYIDLDDGRVEISNLRFSHNDQSILADGFVPMSKADSLTVQLSQFDISNLDLLFASMGFDADGFITGNALVSGLKDDPMVLANLNIANLGVNGDRIGDASLVSLWNNKEKSIDVDANIFDHDKQTLNVEGSYYTGRDKDNLDFNVVMDSLRLASLSPFLTGVVSRMQGWGKGQATVKGSVDKPVIEGQVVLNGGCKVDYLNTFYTFNPTVLIDSKTIRFENMVLVDTLGHKAFVDGSIKHNNLKDFYLDLRLHPKDFLAMATTSKDNSSFYGTAVADGLVSVKGPIKDIALDIKAKTKRGTDFTIPLDKSSTVKENDFIVFVNNVEEEDDEEGLEKKETVKSNFALNLDVNATDDANLKIFLPGKLGTIEAVGNGNMNMKTSSTEDFTMYGDYTIKSGRFQLTLMDVVNRTFSLKEGGTLSFAGNPTDGRINATGSYSVRASLSSLGIPVDSTSNTNVNVECLIHLQGALLNPTFTFGMRLPNASESITQTVFSVVDTTNQAVMQSQALSLLVLNSFAYVGSGTSNLSLSNILGAGMQMNITDNLNLGVSYHAGDAQSNDEYQLALRTQLLENRLSIETNIGMMTSYSADRASSIVGEFDMYYKLTKDGRLQAHFYNHSNYSSNFNSIAFDRRAPYTQGLGLSYSRSFDTFRNLFKKKTTSPNQPLIQPRKRETN